MQVSIDPQIVGVQDDGTPEGVVRSKIAGGEWSRITLADLDLASTTAGAGTVAISRAGVSNADRSGASYNLTTPAALGTNLTTVAAVIYGRTVGVRFRKNTTTPAFSLVIDGRPYDVGALAGRAYFDNSLLSGLGNSKEGVFVVSDLSEGAHSVKVILWPDGVASKTLVIFGFIGERGAGYDVRPGLDSLYGAGTLTNAAVVIPNTDADSNPVHGIKSIWYVNTDASARVVTVSWNSNTVAKLNLAAAGSAGDTGKIDFSTLGLTTGGATANMTHQADATAVVKFNILGAM